jgi:hypothetical protein
MEKLYIVASARPGAEAQYFFRTRVEAEAFYNVEKRDVGGPLTLCRDYKLTAAEAVHPNIAVPPMLVLRRSA